MSEDEAPKSDAPKLIAIGDFRVIVKNIPAAKINYYVMKFINSFFRLNFVIKFEVKNSYEKFLIRFPKDCCDLLYLKKFKFKKKKRIINFTRCANNSCINAKHRT